MLFKKGFVFLTVFIIAVFSLGVNMVFAASPNYIGKYVFTNETAWSFKDGKLSNLVDNNESYTAAILPLKDTDRLTIKANINVITLTTAKGYDGFRILYRYKDDNNYNVLGFFSSGQVHVINRTSSGLKILKTENFQIQAGKSYNIEVTSTESSVALNVDGIKILEYQSADLVKCPPNLGFYSAYSKIEVTGIEAFNPDGKDGVFQTDTNSSGAPSIKGSSGNSGSGTPPPAAGGTGNNMNGTITGKAVDPVKGTSFKLSSITGTGVFSNGAVNLPIDKNEYRTMFLLEPGKKLTSTYALRGKFSLSAIGPDGYNGVRIIFRYTSDSNYYCFMLNKAGEASVLKMSNGQWLELKDDITSVTGFPLTLNREYSFEILTEPANVSIRVDGKEIMKGPLTLGTDAGAGVHMVNAAVKFSNIEFITPEGFVEKVVAVKKDPIKPGNTLVKVAEGGPVSSSKSLIYIFISALVSVICLGSLIFLFFKYKPFNVRGFIRKLTKKRN